MAEGKTYFCIDMKSFYASVECAERGLDPFETCLAVVDASRGKNAICLAISPKMKALGIKTDFDLRHTGEDILGPEVQHFYYDALQYHHAFTPAGKEAVRRLFTDLADPDNYPAYLHCTYGLDRTGTMSYLLLGLLGVSDKDLHRDYELSALYHDWLTQEHMDLMVDMIGDLPGSNTQQRVEYFLLSTGVTKEQIESIRTIFLG